MSVALSAEHLSFRYPALPTQPRAPVILKDIDFALHDGEWLVVLGPTGCGKSTLCAVLAGLAPQLTGGSLSGSLTKTDGHSIGRPSIREIIEICRILRLPSDGC